MRDYKKSTLNPAPPLWYIMDLREKWHRPWYFTIRDVYEKKAKHDWRWWIEYWRQQEAQYGRTNPLRRMYPRAFGNKKQTPTAMALHDVPAPGKLGCGGPDKMDTARTL